MTAVEKSHSFGPIVLSLLHESHVRGIYGGVRSYKIATSHPCATTMSTRIRTRTRDALDRASAILNSFPQTLGEKSAPTTEIERPRVSPWHLWFTGGAQGRRSAWKREEARRKDSLSWNEHRESTWLREIISAASTLTRNQAFGSWDEAKTEATVVRVTPFRSKSPVRITLIPETLGSTSSCVKLFVSVKTRRLAGRLEPLATRIAELDYVSRVCPVIYLSRRPPRGVLRFQHLLTRVFTIMRITQGN